MEQPQYLIDSNAIIDYLGKKFAFNGMSFMNNIIDAIPNISVITKIEVLAFNAPDKHYQMLNNFINDSVVFDLVPAIINKSIAIRKEHKTKLPDTIIAATAIVNSFILITRNITDFKNIDDLQVINLHDI